LDAATASAAAGVKAAALPSTHAIASSLTPNSQIIGLDTETPRTPGVDHASIASAINRYQERRTDAAILTRATRHSVLEIGDRMRGLHVALRSPELEPADLVIDDGCESLIVAELRDAIDPYLDALGREIGFPNGKTWRVASRYFHQRFADLIDLSPLTARCFHKPLGYAGDFEMMNMVYRNESLGETLFGRSLSRVALDSDAGQAVRNRAGYLADKIHGEVRRGSRRNPARVLSVAAGPAIELQLLLHDDASLLEAGRTEITLLDQDATALTHAHDRIHALAAEAGVEVTLRCLKTSIKSVVADGLDDSYDLIYSAGLFDYLNDRAVRRAAARLVAALAQGGSAVIGNFSVANPTRPFMELILDWPLHHRTADDLRHLFGDLGSRVSVEQETTGINLFAVIDA
jgi:hypothetical protein